MSEAFVDVPIAQPVDYYTDMSGFEAAMLDQETVVTPEGTKYRGEEARLGYLGSLLATGFDADPDAHHEMIEQVAAIGYPVDNFKNFVRRPNDKKENQYTLASWGIGTENYGEFSVYELFDRQIPEERLGTLAHESAHANTPLNPNNAHLFGGEAERLEAVGFIIAVADQSLATNKMLNGYHDYLALQYKQRLADPSGLEGIDYRTFVEETSAILSQLALTNRAKIEQIQEQQHKVWDDIARASRAQGKPEPAPKVQLLSQPDHMGVVKPAGIDKTLLRLLDMPAETRGMAGYDRLMAHISGLKARFYQDDTLQVANGRFEAQNAEVITRNAVFLHIITEMAMRDAMAKAEKDENEAKKKKSLVYA
jgi:hypothetical protein